MPDDGSEASWWPITPEWVAARRRRWRFCTRCGLKVFRVRDQAGRTFNVDAEHGTRWCPDHA